MSNTLKLLLNFSKLAELSHSDFLMTIEQGTGGDKNNGTILVVDGFVLEKVD
jgi:hypothetical protein